MIDPVPAEKAAVALLDPPAQAARAHSLGQDCFYEILMTYIDPA